METTNSVSTPPDRAARIDGLLNAIQWWLRPRSVGDEERFREKTMRGIVLLLGFVFTAVLITFILITLFSTSITVPTRVFVTVISGDLIAIAVGLLIHFRRILTASMFIVSTFLIMTIWSTAINGHWRAAPLIFITIAFMLGMLLLPRRNYPVLVISALLTIWVMPFFSPSEELRVLQQLIQEDKLANNVSLNAWVFRVVLSGWLLILAGLFNYYLNEFERRKQALDRLVDTLEDQVKDRTRDLEIAANVATQITTVLDLEELLPQIVNLTQTSFDLYQVSVFLFDEKAHLLKYEAGTGEAGRVMKARGKQFSLDEQGLVPRSARLQKPQRVGDVKMNPNYYQEETLPHTRSELAVPMFIGDKLVGVLDLQSAETFSFTDDDLVVMQQLAKQIAIAVQNARLYAYQLEVAEELRTVDELKSQFLASMSHELRTPLNAILNFSKFINMGIYGDVTEKQVDAMDKIIVSGEHLLALINDVLDITKIESGMMQLFVEDNIDLHKEINPVLTTAETLLSEKPEVEFIPDVDANLPQIIGDKRRLRQILLNLISNACKFTETGSVTLSAKHKGDNILFAVIDTGPGISPNKLDIIFEPFQQTEMGVKHAGGTGLGLPISKKLAEAHHGRLWVETTAGEGSAFFVEIPIRSVELAKQLDQDPAVEA